MTKLMLNPNRVARELDTMFNDILGARPWSNGDSTFVPRVNISENDDLVRINFEVPGMEKKDFKVSIKDKVLTVSGERTFETKEENESWVRTEMTAGRFTRSFTLPDTIDAENVKADYKNGILELTLHKKEESKPREIDVQVS